MFQNMPPEIVATIFAYKYATSGVDMTVNDVIFVASTLKKIMTSERVRYYMNKIVRSYMSSSKYGDLFPDQNSDEYIKQLKLRAYYPRRIIFV